MDISIIILNYNSRELTLNCLKSIKEADFNGLEREIVVIDNNSGDNIGGVLGEYHPEVRFIQNDKNIGMGAGNNAGIREASGKYIVIMNPDTVAYSDTFKKLHDFMEKRRDVGVVGPKQYYPDNTIQNSCYRWYGLLTPIYRRTPLGRFKFAQKDIDRLFMKDVNRDTEIEVDWLLGSFLFCRAEALNDVGLFDEDFFLYFEDTDLAKRFWKNNWKVVYHPDVKIIHNHNRESARDPWYKFFTNKATREHLKSWIKYLKKWGIKNNK